MNSSQKNNVAVVIPAYKHTLKMSEAKSFEQILRCVSGRSIFLIHGESLNLNSYEDLARKAGVDFIGIVFPDHYFRSVMDYNRLLLSRNFYKAFEAFDYMFIYQLDAWIFRDELDYWTSLDYDNIGAPWFSAFDENSTAIAGAGNGGCCLRHVGKSIKVLSSLKYIENPFRLIRGDYSAKHLLKLFLTGNNFHHKLNDYSLNEDYFFSRIIPNRFKWWKNCPPGLAMKFSFEMNPSYLYAENNGQLPMCCHAWEKYEPEFWKDFIEIDS